MTLNDNGISKRLSPVQRGLAALGLGISLSFFPLVAEEPAELDSDDNVSTSGGEIYGPPLIKRWKKKYAETHPAPTSGDDDEAVIADSGDSSIVPRSAGFTNGSQNRHGPRLIERLPRFQGEANQSVIDTGVGSPKARENPILDRIWSWPVIHRNPDARFLQEFSLFGRYQGQFYSVNSQQGSVNGWESRRSRIGARAIFFENFTAAASFNTQTDRGSGLSNVIDKENVDTLTIAWSPSDNFQAVLGQQKAGFSYEYDVSSNRMLTFERSLIVNQVVPDKAPGLSVEGKREKFDYHLGFYSGDTIGSSLDHGFGMLKLGYDLSDSVDVEKFGAQFYYLRTSDPTGSATAPYENSFSVSSDFQDGPYAGFAQIVYVDGFGATSNAWGLTVMPSYFILEDKLQLVGRYQFASSADPDGLAAQNRYEQDVPFITDGGRGDSYHAGYLGLNWYIYGREMKIMTGAEYSTLNGGIDGGDFDGWTWFGGLRLHF